jgi:membrane-bound serine protease (ClpP class)
LAQEAKVRFRTRLLAGCVLAAAWCAAEPCVVVLDWKGAVHTVTTELLDSAITLAERESCGLLLARVNTPGGYAEAARQTIERIVGSPIPVAVYVAPSGGRAASAGFLLLEAADIAAMAPGTNTGAAHPVLIGGTPDEILKKKIENDAAAAIRSLAERRGRNSKLAEAAAVESRSFTEVEALKENLIDVVARTDGELIAWADGREVTRFDGTRQKLALAGARIVRYEPNTQQKVQIALSNPNLALALLILGLLGLYVEFTTPGAILPGVLGGILLLLGMAAFSVLPVTWVGVGLLLLAVALFVLEAKVASGGVLGAGGAVAMVLGSLFLVDSPVPELRIQLYTALGLSLPFAIITGFLVALVVRTRSHAPEMGNEVLLGAEAEALTALAPRGQVLIRGEIWQARASSPVAAGARVRVTAVQGLDLTVEADSGGSDA